MLEKGVCEGGLQLPVVASVTGLLICKLHASKVWVLLVKYSIQTYDTSQLVYVDVTALRKHCKFHNFCSCIVEEKKRR